MSGDRDRSLNTHVFSGDWLKSTDSSCSHQYREGFAGISAGMWNGWEVPSVTREVMAAIVDSHHDAMAAMIAIDVAAGWTLDEAWLDALQRLASVSWMGWLVIVDSRVLQGDPTLVEVVAPDRSGRYRAGFAWEWDAVDPADVHRIHGVPGGGNEDPGHGPFGDRGPTRPHREL
jgi:hypothetical protein